MFLAIILVASIGVFAAAWIGDLAFDLAACTPCFFQRVPYVMAAAVSGVAVVAQPQSARYRRVVIVCALLFASSAGFAALREGAHQGWWSIPGLCETAPALASARTTLAGDTIRSACDDTEADASTLAMSLTMINFTCSGALTLACIIAAAFADGTTGQRRGGSGRG